MSGRHTMSSRWHVTQSMFQLPLRYGNGEIKSPSNCRVPVIGRCMCSFRKYTQRARPCAKRSAWPVIQQGEKQTQPLPLGGL